MEDRSKVWCFVENSVMERDRLIQVSWDGFGDGGMMMG